MYQHLEDAHPILWLDQQLTSVPHPRYIADDREKGQDVVMEELGQVPLSHASPEPQGEC